MTMMIIVGYSIIATKHIFCRINSIALSLVLTGFCAVGEKDSKYGPLGFLVNFSLCVNYFPVE